MNSERLAKSSRLTACFTSNFNSRAPAFFPPQFVCCHFLANTQNEESQHSYYPLASFNTSLSAEKRNKLCIMAKLNLWSRRWLCMFADRKSLFLPPKWLNYLFINAWEYLNHHYSHRYKSRWNSTCRATLGGSIVPWRNCSFWIVALQIVDAAARGRFLRLMRYNSWQGHPFWINNGLGK